MRHMDEMKPKTLTKITYFEYNPAPLAEKRNELGMTQEQVGKLLGLHNVTINRIERGVNADYDSVLRYCALLEVPSNKVVLHQVMTNKKRGPSQRFCRKTYI